MPIDRATFDHASRPLQDRISQFLADAPDQAFSLVEILVSSEGLTKNAALMAVLTTGGVASKYSTALAQLAKRGQVSEAEYRGVTYYMHRPDQP